MNRRVRVLAVLAAACLVVAVPAAARTDGVGPPPGLHGALRLEVLSGPAQYVSGGAARVRVVVPAAVRSTQRPCELNGADVTSSFATGRPDAARARGRADGTAARPEHGRGARARPGEFGERPRHLDARQLPDHGPDVRGAEAARLLLLDAATSPGSTSPGRSSTRTARCRRASTTTTGPPTGRGSRSTPRRPGLRT